MPDLIPRQKQHALKQARKLLRIKLQSEKPFKRDLISYFAKVRRSVASGGFHDPIEPLLNKHYRRVVRNLTGIKLKQEEDEYGLEEAILAILAGRAVRQSGIIDRTTEKLIRESREEALQQLIAEGMINHDQGAINRTAANIFKVKNGGRVGNITVTETQMLTEEVKKTMQSIADDMMNDAIVDGNRALAREAADLSGSLTHQEIADDIGRVDNADLFALLAVVSHTWVTMGDAKVRPWHQAANFQTVPRTEPFIVNGEYLRYPGDTSMGASMANVANCRCSEVIL